jgi:hypothetical protein
VYIISLPEVKLPKMLFPKVSFTERVSLWTVKLLLLLIRMLMLGFAGLFVGFKEVVLEDGGVAVVLVAGGVHWFTLNKVNRIDNPRCVGSNG